MRSLMCTILQPQEKRVRYWRLLKLLDQGNVVSFQQNLADLAPLLGCVLLRKRDFNSVVNDQVHELVEALLRR